MPEPLQRLRRGLLRNPGGDRVMAQVLAIVLSAGLDAVLVAVELALETGPPGKVSVEHVVNVLGRLNAQPAPPTAATQLKVTTPPLADTARYDRLRGLMPMTPPRRPAMRLTCWSNSRRCACTAWPAPGPIWSSKVERRAWSPRAG
jgi:hypothetical protein